MSERSVYWEREHWEAAGVWRIHSSLLWQELHIIAPTRRARTGGDRASNATPPPALQPHSLDATSGGGDGGSCDYSIMFPLPT